MFPNFYTWLEDSSSLDMQNAPNEDSMDSQEDSSSLSEPQDKVGETSLTLNKLVEKRIKEMMNELQNKGKGSEEDILNSINYFLSKNGSAPKEDQKTPEEQPMPPMVGPQAPMQPMGGPQAPMSPMGGPQAQL